MQRGQPVSAFASLRTVGRKRPSELHQALHRSRLLRPPCRRRPSSMRLLAGTVAPSLSVPMHFRADPRAPVPRCSFQTLGVFAPLCLPLEFLGLSEPMEAQAMAWPHIYTGEDVVLVSEAGSGKTIAQVHNGVCGECAALARVRKRARSVSVRETDRCARERSLDKDEFHQTVSTRQRVWTSIIVHRTLLLFSRPTSG